LNHRSLVASFFFLAIMLSAGVGGLGPGLLAAALHIYSPVLNV